MSLTTCIQKAGKALHPEDKAAILERSRVLRGEGKTLAEAARIAVTEQMSAVQALLGGHQQAQAKGAAPPVDGMPAEPARWPGDAEKPFVYSSGMSSRPDFTRALAANHSIGIDIGEMSANTIAEIGPALAKSTGHLFVDSGAFSLFRAQQRENTIGEVAGIEHTTGVQALDFKRIFQRYDQLQKSIAEADPNEETGAANRVAYAMPDVVGDQKASLELLRQFKENVQDWTDFASNAIVPLQGGALTLTQMYDQAAKILERDMLTIGIPSKVEAVSNEQFQQLMKDRGDVITGVHLLGAGSTKTLAGRMDALQAANYDGPVSADANRLRTLWTRKNARTEAFDHLMTVQGPTFGSLQPAVEAAAAPQAAAPKKDALRSQGQKMIEQGQADQGRDRLANTARRARMASSAEAGARANEAMGNTLVNLADAIEQGRAPALEGISTKAQVEALNSRLQTAMQESNKAKNLTYSQEQSQRGRPADAADIARARLPVMDWGSASDRNKLAELLKGKRGAKELADSIRSGRAPTPEMLAELKTHLTEQQIAPDFGWWNIERAAQLERLRRAGITTNEQLQKALAEFVEFRKGVQAEDPIKAAERALVGRKGIGIDFFPTPKPVAESMVRYAGIKTGDRVLEPSAGTGALADVAKAAGAKVDTLEISSELRDLLKLKGYPIIGNDFMDMKPPAELYDSVILNPPFSNRADAAHIQHAYDMVKPGGKVVALAGEGVFFGSDKKAQAFREWLLEHGAHTEKLPANSFMGSQQLAQTGANARLIVIDKPAVGVRQSEAPYTQPFYSELARHVDRVDMNAAPAASWKAWLKGLTQKGVKPDEIAWTGINEYLDLQQGKVTKTQVQEFLKANGVQVSEKVLGTRSINDAIREAAGDADVVTLLERTKLLEERRGRNTTRINNTTQNLLNTARQWSKTADGALPEGDAGQFLPFETVDRARKLLEIQTEPKYGQYTLPGGTNYREVLLTLPAKIAPEDRALADAKHARAVELRKEYNALLHGGLGEMNGDEAELGRRLRNLETQIRMLTEARDKINEGTGFQSAHWSEPNILASIRLNDRVDSEGKRVLFIEEIQSDWGQAGKKARDSEVKSVARERGITETEASKLVPADAGFLKNADSTGWKATANVGDPGWYHVRTATNEALGQYRANSEAEAIAAAAQNFGSGSVPRAPFVGKTDAWVALALKRVIKMAADEGYDRVAFVTGEQSAERYSLRKQVRSIEWSPFTVSGGNMPGGTHVIIDTPAGLARFNVGGDGVVSSAPNPGILRDQQIVGKRLDDVVGKAAAEKIMGSYRGKLEGEGLNIGGEGMIIFYDKIVPSVLKDVLKKVGGGQLESVEFGDMTARAREPYIVSDGPGFFVEGGGPRLGPFSVKEQAQIALDKLLAERKRMTQPGFAITDAMREKAASGMSLFSRREAYNPSQGELFAGSRAEPTAAAAGRTAAGPAASLRGDTGALPRVRIQALGIAADIQRTGSAAFVGRQVTSADDLAAMAQVYRDPRYETFRMFFMRGTEVVQATGVSARMPGFTSMVPGNMNPESYIAFIAAEKARLNADGYYILHNHPSGDPTPSLVDHKLTAYIAQKVKGLIAHVVIDTNRYAVIESDGTGQFPSGAIMAREFGRDTLLVPSRPSPVIGMKIENPKGLAQLGLTFKQPGWITIIGTSANNSVRMIAEAPTSILSRPNEVLLGTARRLMRRSGSSNLSLIGDADAISRPAVKEALRQGIIRDAVVGGQTVTQAERGLGGRSATDYFSPRMQSQFVAEPTTVYESPDPYAVDQPPAPPGKQTKLELRFDPGWSMPQGTRFDNFIYRFQDKYIDLKRATAAIEADGKAIEDRADAYLQEELFHGRAAKRVQDFVQRELDPLLKDMATRKMTQEELNKFLLARHAEEANKLISERNPEIPDGGSGMKTADAKAYLDGLTPERRADLNAMAAQVDSIIGKTRDIYVDYGLIDKGTVDAWGKMFSDYVPLMREGKDLPQMGTGTGQGFSIKGKEVKHRTGSTAEVQNIIANVARQRERALVRGEKNRVAVAMAALAKLNPNPDVWEVGKPPQERYYNEVSGMVESRVPPQFKNQPNVLVAKVTGKEGAVHEVAIIFNEKNERAMRLAGALKNLDATDLEGWIANASKVTRYIASMATQYNVVFGVVNLVRDQQTAALNLGSTPLAGHRIELLKQVLPALAGVYRDTRVERAGGEASSAWAKIYEDFQNEGGQTGYRDLYRTTEDRAKAIESSLNPQGWMDSPLGKVFTIDGALRVPMAGVQNSARWIFNWISDYNSAMENGTRLAAYKTALDHGMSKQQAASLAKNLTVNFNRKGASSRGAGSLYAFFNANMQGIAREGELMTERSPTGEYRFSKRGLKIIAGGVSLGVIQALMLAAAGFGDDEPPQFVRERNLIIPWGTTGKYTSIPLLLGLNVLPNIGRIFTEWAMHGFKEPTKYAHRLISIFADMFNPLGGGPITWQTWAPSALDPAVAIATNTDWTGRKIALESRNPAQPGHELARDVATGPARLIAEAINRLTGGTKHTAGILSPTPDQIDYLWGQITGGVGRELAKAEESIKAAKTGEALPAYKIPLIGRFYGDTKDSSAEANRFFENANRINVHETELKGLEKEAREAAKAGDMKHRDEVIQERAQYLKDHPDAYLIDFAKRVEREVSDLRKEKRRLVKADAPREDVKKIEDRMKSTMHLLNEAVAKRTD